MFSKLTCSQAKEDAVGTSTKDDACYLGSRCYEVPAEEGDAHDQQGWAPNLRPNINMHGNSRQETLALR